MRATVIGAGYSGLAVGSLLKKQGWDVTIIEKNPEIGGRARLWEEKGYSFDMGPSWYLMPEVFERYFELLGTKRENYFSLKKLDPHYKVYFENQNAETITADLEKTKALFESFEPGGGKQLGRFLDAAKYKYDTAMNEFVYKSYKSLFDFFNWKVLTEGLKLDIFSSLDKNISKYFKDERAKKILEYTMVFLGTSPKDAPALYTIMSHVDLNLGVYFPDGGLNGVAMGMAKLFQEMGGKILLNTDVTHIQVMDSKAYAVVIRDGEIPTDLVINSGDYRWGETQLLQPDFQTYKEGYWKKRVVAPSMFILYLGVKGLIEELEHHNLYFPEKWNDHFDKIFNNYAWPENPCFYLSAITKTDPKMAPKNSENLFLLVPIAPGLSDPKDFRERYAEKMIAHVEEKIGHKFRDRIEVMRVFGPSDFSEDYHAYQGTALGISHTLFQTAVFRPRTRSKKVRNLFYTGQYTHPGVGVAMALISAELVAKDIERIWRKPRK